jgi:hypothetical protein
VVDARKQGWLGGGRGEVTGSAWLTQGFTRTEITLKTDKPKGPHFFLYFSAAPVKLGSRGSDAGPRPVESNEVEVGRRMDPQPQPGLCPRHSSWAEPRSLAQ